MLTKIRKFYANVKDELVLILFVLVTLYFSDYFINIKAKEYWEFYCNLGILKGCVTWGFGNLTTDVVSFFLGILFIFLIFGYKAYKDILNEPKKVIFIFIFFLTSIVLLLNRNLILYSFSALLFLLIMKSDTALTKSKDVALLFEQIIIPVFTMILFIFLMLWIVGGGGRLVINSYYKYGSQLNPYFQNLNLPFKIEKTQPPITKYDIKVVRYDDEPDLGLKISSSSAWIKPTDPMLITSGVKDRVSSNGLVTDIGNANGYINGTNDTKPLFFQDQFDKLGLEKKYHDLFLKERLLPGGKEKVDFNNDGVMDDYFQSIGDGCASCHTQFMDMFINNKRYSFALNEGQIYSIKNGFYATNYFMGSEPATCCPDNIVISKYQWNGDGFTEEERKTVWISIK